MSVARKPNSVEPLRRRIFLTSRFHTGQYPNSQKHDRAYRNPMPRHMHQVRPVNQPANQDRKSNRVYSKRHIHLLESNAEPTSYEFSSLAREQPEPRLLSVLASINSAALL